MISFECDYNNGAHPKVLQRLVDTNNLQSLTYGADKWSESAREKIKAACEDDEAEVFFLCGGTQTNVTIIDSIIEGYEAVVAADSAHINTHEAAAMEFSHHKIITLPDDKGKLRASDLKQFMEEFTANDSAPHLAQPGLVYITFPTEYGTIYSAQEISDLYNVCKTFSLPLFVDGARLGYGLMADGCDITLPWLARHCDAFYIGGTKEGALCGEAVVFPHHNAPRHLFTIVKQHGALMAKGRLTGLQFEALFTDGLYFSISRHAVEMAMKMRKMFADRGYKFYIDSPTNQQFIILNNEKVKQLEKYVLFTHWGPAGNGKEICRFVTSWSTTDEELTTLETLLD